MFSIDQLETHQSVKVKYDSNHNHISGKEKSIKHVLNNVIVTDVASLREVNHACFHTRTIVNNEPTYVTMY